MKKYIDYIRTKAELSKDFIQKNVYQQKISSDSNIALILQDLSKTGIHVIPDFLDSNICQEIRAEIDEIILERPTQIWSDQIGSDHRLWGYDRISQINYNFYTDSRLVRLREAFYSIEDQHIDGFTMANRISPKPGNLGSGGGWHRDVVNVQQLKTILYLSDVEESNGPFQYVLQTQKKNSVLKSIIDHNFNFNHNRFTQKEVEKILLYPEYKSQVFTGTAGTLIITDTSGIHRGMPIQKDSRHALTNYCWVGQSKGGKGIPANIQKILLK